MAKHGKADHHGTSEKEGSPWGRGEFANMPQEKKMDPYPKANEFGPGQLDDTISEIDGTTSRAHTKSHKFLSNQH